MKHAPGRICAWFIALGSTQLEGTNWQAQTHFVVSCPFVTKRTVIGRNVIAPFHCHQFFVFCFISEGKLWSNWQLCFPVINTASLIHCFTYQPTSYVSTLGHFLKVKGSSAGPKLNSKSVDDLLRQPLFKIWSHFGDCIEAILVT